MVKPPTLVGGLLLFSSAAHRDAYTEQEAERIARTRLPELIREHIRSIPELTPEREAQEWAEITIALAAVSSRKSTE